MYSSATRVDVGSGGRRVAYKHMRSQWSKQSRSDFAHRAVCAVDDNAQSGKPVTRRKMRGEDLLVPLHPSRRIGSGNIPPGNVVGMLLKLWRVQQLKDARLDLCFVGISQFRSVGGEDFDPVIFVRIMRSGNHDTARIAERFR